MSEIKIFKESEIVENQFSNSKEIVTDWVSTTLYEMIKTYSNPDYTGSIEISISRID